MAYVYTKFEESTRYEIVLVLCHWLMWYHVPCKTFKYDKKQLHWQGHPWLSYNQSDVGFLHIQWESSV